MGDPTEEELDKDDYGGSMSPEERDELYWIGVEQDYDDGIQ
jgi:hypothetical protein